MLIVLEKLLILYTYLLIGWFFGRKNKNLQGHTSILSYLLVNFFLPCKVFFTFSRNFTLSYLSEYYPGILLSFGFVLLFHFLSGCVSRWFGRDDHEKRVFEYACVVPNCSYMGYHLAESLYGTAGLTDMTLFSIPSVLYAYTVGYMKLTGSGKNLKRILNMMTVAIAAGVVFGIAGWMLPDVAVTVLNNGSSCVGPVSMLLTGIVLSSFTVKGLFLDGMTYVIAGIRLVVIPLFTFGICKLLGLNNILPVMLLMMGMPLGQNAIVFSKNAGKDPSHAARLVFVSHLLTCITLPLILALI